MNIHLLDMGQTKYGDCILVTRDNRRILIDGGHISDASFIASQLKRILKVDPPFNIDLLVVTHCHGDHIGCLPELIDEDVVRPRLALLADEKLGWGVSSTGDHPMDSLPVRRKQLLSALLEEDHSDLDDRELVQFIQDAVKLEDKYKDMISSLEQSGVRIVRYGRDNHKPLEAAFKDFGLRILGPTTDHLIACAEEIANSSDQLAADTLKSVDDIMPPEDIARLYRDATRRIVEDSLGAADRPGPGAARNNQSIVLKVQADGWSALLAGDMQFAKSEVRGLDEEMKSLREKVVAAGPYDFVKLTHHTSYNGFNRDVINDYPQTQFFAHSGGRKDPTHPDEDALQLLEEREDRLKFARTDRNGLITVRKAGSALRMDVSKGRLNDFTANTSGDEEQLSGNATPEVGGGVATTVQPSGTRATRSMLSENQPVIEITTRIPVGVKRVSFTIDIECAAATEAKDSEKKKIVSNLQSPDILIGGGRRLPRLLFVTASQRLKANIGSDEGEQVLSALRKREDIDLLEIMENNNTVESVAACIRDRLRAGGYKGVVLIGGYDVIPSQVVDVIDRSLRDQLIKLNLDREDADDFVVWSDDVYGDTDGDLLPELPVSRIPDGRHPGVVRNALQAVDGNGESHYGIRNIARPFADTTFATLTGQRTSINVSATYGPLQVPTDAARGFVYYMLHGSYRDATAFWGETEDGDEFEAINLSRIPAVAHGTTVFTGCCWGALPVFQRAVTTKTDPLLAPKTPEQSIALSYLLAGVQAFVGCTGSHYSPLRAPFDYYGKPMHDHFWQGIASGLKPALALLEAKREYAKGMPHGRKDAFSRAVEAKIFSQFTCLGLGW